MGNVGLSRNPSPTGGQVYQVVKCCCVAWNLELCELTYFESLTKQKAVQCVVWAVHQGSLSLSLLPRRRLAVMTFACLLLSLKRWFS